MIGIIIYIILFFVQIPTIVHVCLYVQPGECAVTGGELKPVQLSVNAYLGNITYLRCPSKLTYNYYQYHPYIQSYCVDSYTILNYNLAPND